LVLILFRYRAGVDLKNSFKYFFKY
jgi:hypothetical protein